MQQSIRIAVGGRRPSTRRTNEHQQNRAGRHSLLEWARGAHAHSQRVIAGSACHKSTKNGKTTGGGLAKGLAETLRDGSQSHNHVALPRRPVVPVIGCPHAWPVGEAGRDGDCRRGWLGRTWLSLVLGRAVLAGASAPRKATRVPDQGPLCQSSWRLCLGLEIVFVCRLFGGI
jgi:hypothetical protein